MPVEVERRDVLKETKSTADQRSTRKMTGEWSLDLVTTASLKWWNWRPEGSGPPYSLSKSHSLCL